MSRDDRPGLRTEWGFTRSIEDSTSWDPAWLHPDRQELVCEILADGRGRTVEELAQVLRGRRPPRGATGGGVRVLQARNITAGLPPAQDLELMPAGPSPDTLVQVRLGDVVGSISGPAGRWAVIPADYEGVIAGDHTVVIRLHDSSPVSARYLLTWLCSEAARPLFAVRGAVIKRLDLRELSRLPVPIVAEPMNLVDAQLLQLAEATSLVESKLDSLRSSQASIFGGLQTAEVGRRLAEVAAQAASTSAGLQRHDDLLTRVQDLYPYPVARNARALRLAQAPRARYDEILNTFESTLIFLALIALSWSRSIGATTPELENWRSKIHSGGASLGIWLGLTRSIAEFASARGSDMAGLAPAMSDNGRTGLRRSLDLLLTERNRTHGGRPQSDAVYGDRADETMPVLERALEAAAFLVGCELAYVDDVRPIEHPRGVRYAVTAQRAMGDHPDWDLLSFELTNVVFDGRFYLFLGSDVLPVAPFLIARRCDECRQRHVYCPDEVSKSRVRFNSIDRGHERRDDDLSMVEAVREAIPRPQGP